VEVEVRLDRMLAFRSRILSGARPCGSCNAERKAARHQSRGCMAKERAGAGGRRGTERRQSELRGVHAPSLASPPPSDLCTVFAPGEGISPTALQHLRITPLARPSNPREPLDNGQRLPFALKGGLSEDFSQAKEGRNRIVPPPSWLPPPPAAAAEKKKQREQRERASRSKRTDARSLGIHRQAGRKIQLSLLLKRPRLKPRPSRARERDQEQGNKAKRERETSKVGRRRRRRRRLEEEKTKKNISLSLLPRWEQKQKPLTFLREHDDLDRFL